MSTMMAKGATCGFGRLIYLARAEPMAVARYRRPTVVRMAVDEYEGLMALELAETLTFADECSH